MTKLKHRAKPLWRETMLLGERGQPYVVALQPEGLLIRRKGSRKPLLLPYGIAFVKAAMIQANKDRAEKKQRRSKVKRGVLA